MSLSFSRKVIVLVTVPVVFELILVSALFLLLTKVETAREQAAHARDLGGHLNSLMAHAMQRASTVMEGHAREEGRIADHNADIDDDLREIDRLVAENPREREEAARIKELFLHIDAGFSKASDLYHDDRELDAFAAWHKLHGDVERFFALTNALAGEESQAGRLHEQEVHKLESYWSLTLYLSAALSIFLAFGLAAIFNRTTTDRLNALMATARLLAAGKPPASRIGGSDELAKLDSLMARMHSDLEALRRKERAVLDNAAEIVLSIDAGKRIVEINDAVGPVWGYSKEEIIGKRLSDLIVESDREMVGKLLDELPAGSDKVRFECAVMRGSSLNAAHMSWSVSWSNTERSYYCVVSDISERVELARLKEEFIAMISHDLRTPLSSVQVALDLLERSAGQAGGAQAQALDQTAHLADQDEREILARAQKNLKLTLKLINDLLDMQKLETSGALSLDAVSTKELFTAARNAVADLATDKNIAINLPEDNFEIVGDRDRLVQVLINLFGNALKFAPAGSSVDVAVEERNSMLRVIVADQGEGVRAEEQALIFERFKQGGKGDKSGSGLGLAICKAVVEAHGGTIGVDSGAQGSRFWFELPLQQ